MNFNFIKSDGSLVTGSFSAKPINYPIPSGSYLITGDVVTYCISPTSSALVPNTYDVQLNTCKTNNDWFIAVTTSSFSVVSGSSLTGSSVVTFDLSNSVNAPFAVKTIEVKPINRNVTTTGSLVVSDAILLTTDINGVASSSLLIQPYMVTLYGDKKHTLFQIVPTGTACNVKDVIVTSSITSNVITPQNSALYSYTAQASDARYMPSGSSPATASYAISALTASVLNNPHIDVNAMLLKDSNNTLSANWDLRQLFGFNGVQVMNWGTSGETNQVSINLAGGIPEHTLDVNGDINTRGNFLVNGSPLFPDITDVAGKVGINQSSPAYTFDVNGDMGNSAGTLNIDNSGTRNIFIGDAHGIISGMGITVDAGAGIINLHDGNVGINNPAPTHALDVVGDFQAQTPNGVTLINSDSLREWNDGGNGGTINLIVGGASLTVNGDNNGVGIGNSSPGFTLDVNGYIGNSAGTLNIGHNGNRVIAIGDVDNDNNAPTLTLDGGNQVAYIVSNGGNANFGIQTTSPQHALDVLGNGFITLGLIGTTGNRAAILFESTDGGAQFEFGSDIGASGGHDFYVYDSQAGQPIMTIDSSQNTTFYANLDFNGSLNNNGSIYVPANATSASHATSSSYAVNASIATSASYVNAATVLTSQTLTMPYSSSGHALTPTVTTGSHYVQVGTTNLFFVYNGTRWCSSSLA